MPSPYKDIDLFKDYTKVKPTQSSSEDVREPSQMAVDADDDVFKKKTVSNGLVGHWTCGPCQVKQEKCLTALWTGFLNNE